MGASFLQIMLAFSKKLVYTVFVPAGVMELVDVVDSKSTDGDIVPVRVRPPAPKISRPFMGSGYFYCRDRDESP